MLRINVTTAEAVITETELITSGRKGLRCAFTFSDDWAGLAKTVIVQGAATRDIALLATNEITVPAECVNKAQFPLKIGVYGAKPDGTIAIPTIWASFGKVLPGAKPSDIPPDELTPDVAAQIQEAANNALYLARNVQSMADSGALDGVSPAVTVTSITGGHNIKITDRDHPDGQAFDVPDGQDGQDGQDGVSPTVTSESITGGHRLTITDADGVTTVDVMDGQDGQDAVVDPTLSNPGEAADAAETGKVKHTANYALTFAETLNSGAGIPVDAVWQLGGFASDGTNENSRTYRARMKSRMSFPADVTFKAANGYQMQYVLWDSEGTRKSSGSWITSKTVSAGDLVRIGVRAYPEDTSITADPDVFGAAITIQNNIGSGGGGGGGITVDDALSRRSTNPVQNKVIKAALDGKGTYSKPSGGIPASDLASAVQTSLGKADTALQSFTETDPTVPSWAKASSKPSYTASDVGAVAVAQGVAHAGEFVVVGSDGNVTTMALSTWSAGSY